MSAMIRMWMLADFLLKQEIDIILLQEVTYNDFDFIRGYIAYTKVGINKRGTAILTREAIQLNNITRLHLRRGMTAFYRGVWIVNIYAPSGSSNRQETETFYSVDLTYLLRSLPPTMIIGGGDFNCALTNADGTGSINFSKALDKIEGLI
jgi:exonuclease III